MAMRQEDLTATEQYGSEFFDNDEDAFLKCLVNGSTPPVVVKS